MQNAKARSEFGEAKVAGRFGLRCESLMGWIPSIAVAGFGIYVSAWADSSHRARRGETPAGQFIVPSAMLFHKDVPTRGAPIAEKS